MQGKGVRISRVNDHVIYRQLHTPVKRTRRLIMLAHSQTYFLMFWHWLLNQRRCLATACVEMRQSTRSNFWLVQKKNESSFQVLSRSSFKDVFPVFSLYCSPLLAKPFTESLPEYLLEFHEDISVDFLLHRVSQNFYRIYHKMFLEGSLSRFILKIYWRFFQKFFSGVP